MKPHPDPHSKENPAPTGSTSIPEVRIPTSRPNERGNEPTEASSNKAERVLRRVGSEGSTGQPGAAQSSSAEPGSPAQSTPNIKISRPDAFAAAAATPPPPPANAQAASGGKQKTAGAALAPQPRSAKSAWTVRAVILLSVTGCLALLYWSVFVRLLPVTTEHREKALEMTRTADELEQLRARWTAQQIEEIKEQYARAQEALFQREEELATWEEETRNEASARVLAATLKRQPAITSRADGIQMITAQVDVFPEDIFGSTNSPYNRLLLFADALARSPKRLDLIDLSVVGNSNSISQAQAVVQLFSTEKPL